ncbi:MAG TPA: TonB family protein [Candidatus Acidoferrum sp.]|nr:TonB family protein [Candidatus Acidoferrum sp.]
MTEPTKYTKKWEGQIVDEAFPLQQFLGETQHSAVFLTEYGEEPRQKAVIKLVHAEQASADLQLARWKEAAALSHPNLLKIFQMGRCRLEDHDLLYLVMEYAEEDLAEILRQRALTADETRDMLGPVVEVLGFLHGKGFVHGDVKPANILATSDTLKISSDTLRKSGESAGIAPQPGAHDAPEAISGNLTAASDVWALGSTLVEVLTQKLPDWQPGPEREPVVPANLPFPLGELARRCLRLEPAQRATLAEVAALLSPKAAVAAAAAASGPSGTLSVSSAPSGDVTNYGPAGGQTVSVGPRSGNAAYAAPKAAARLQTRPHRPPAYKLPGSRTRFLIPLAAGAVIFAAILTVPRLFTQRSANQKSSPALAAEAEPAVTASKAVETKKPVSRDLPKRDAPAVTRSAEKQRPQVAANAGSITQSDTLKPAKESEAPAPSTAPATPSEVSATPSAARVGAAKGAILDQVMPEVPAKAQATIWGRVRVGIKLKVDAAGAVSDAEFVSPGPSKYFADLAMNAARKWVFTPPEMNGKSVASEWNLRFVFTNSDTKVATAQSAP